MINYSLSFIEDLREELGTKKIICLGTPLDIKDKIKTYNISPHQIECCCDVFMDSDCNTASPLFNVFDLSHLDTIDVSKYILLIVDSNVDQVKKHLRSLKIYNQSSVINCYKLPLNRRYYNNPDEVVAYRYTTPLAFWKEYCLKKVGIIDQAEHHKHCIPRVILVLTTKCNLRCKDCIALTPYYKNSYHVPLAILIRSIEKFLSDVEYCYCLELLGGEPFLYPDINELLNHLIMHDKISTIQITTNGLADIDDSTINLLKNKKVHVRISNYDIGNKEKQLSFQEKIKAAGINFWVQSDIAWLPIGNLHKRNENHQTLMDEYSLCFEGLNCKTILNGNLYSCTFASRIADLGIATDIEYIDLLNEAVTWNQLFSFWNMPYCSACDYCKMMDPNAQCISSALQV